MIELSQRRNRLAPENSYKGSSAWQLLSQVGPSKITSRIRMFLSRISRMFYSDYVSCTLNKAAMGTSLSITFLFTDTWMS